MALGFDGQEWIRGQAVEAEFQEVRWSQLLTAATMLKQVKQLCSLGSNLTPLELLPSMDKGLHTPETSFFLTSMVRFDVKLGVLTRDSWFLLDPEYY